MSEVIDTLLQGSQQPITPPLVVLGQFERVGSTFYLDQLEKTHLVHNEPYKLLVPGSWSIARDYDGALSTVDEFFEDPDVSGVDKHWFRNFVASLHHPEDQVVKETNLYLAVPNFLECFPRSDIRLLTRNPLGIISSFKRNNLYERWHYADVAQTVSNQLNGGRPDNHEAMQHMLREGEVWPAKLAWMIGLNAVLLSRHVDPARVTEVIRYQEDVVPKGSVEAASNDRENDSIFSTNIYKTHDDFEARLTDEELTLLGITMTACSDFVQSEFDENDRYWFDQLYTRHLGSERIASTAHDTKKLGKVSNATEAAPLHGIDTRPEFEQETARKLVKLHEGQPLLWDYSLITNHQMGSFLQSLLKNGLDPANNHLLLLDSMPPSRGGRIMYDKEAGEFKAAESFDDYPAYWITWLGAALYAYKEGMRLPTYAEWQEAYESLDPAMLPPNPNHSYAHDDATPTGQGASQVPDDFFGNLKIWCSDWSDEEALSKSLAGISWKHHLHDDYKTKTERPYLTNSRVIGVRLVCCSECEAPQPRSMADVKQKLDEVVKLMESVPVKTIDDLRMLNQNISDTLTLTPCSH